MNFAIFITALALRVFHGYKHGFRDASYGSRKESFFSLRLNKTVI
jgi:hypothetical protein